MDIAADIRQVVGIANNVIAKAALPYCASERWIEFGYGSGGETFEGADDFGEGVLDLYEGGSETRPYKPISVLQRIWFSRSNSHRAAFWWI